jgi:class 3 adenylate cyclase/tetratricopeptide (TPR) repeat protein
MSLPVQPAALDQWKAPARCGVCQSAVDPGDAFCGSCGAPVVQALCPQCHQRMRRESAYCVNCGYRLDGEPKSIPSAPDQPASERKYLTIMYVDLRESTELTASLEAEQAVARLEPALTAMRAAVRRHGGIVSKELGDGLVALFGAPRSDANHAVMACHAAVELTCRIAQLGDPGLQVRVGIHSGYVITRLIRGDYSTVYEGGGPAMALANRLETAAVAGQILVSDSCQRLCEGLISFEALGPKPLKGFKHAVPMYRVIGVTGQSRWHGRAARGLSRFAGRASELLALERAAAEAATGAGHIVSIVGDPGIGKSRIAHEFLSRLERAGWQVIEVECSPTSQMTPYAALNNLLLATEASQNRLCAKLDDLLQGEGISFPKIWSSAIDAVRGRPIADAEWEGLEPRLRRRAIIDAYRALVERIVNGQRTVILIEDLHWIDDASEAPIEALGSIVARQQLLILLTRRPGTGPQPLVRRNAVILWLHPLDPSAANALLDSLLGTSPGLADLKARILRHTGMVPLFIEEVTRDLVETGVITSQRDALAPSTSLEQLGVPPTVHGVIAGRIDRLAGPEKMLLQAASAIGSRADISLLRAVAEIPEITLQTSLASLDASELLREVSLLPQRVFAFTHDLIREVAHGSLTALDREQLHSRILRGLEATLQDRKEEAEALSHHAVQARAWPEASTYAHLAAQKCLARSALFDAARYFEIAIDAVDRLHASLDREQRAIDLRIEARLAIPSIGNVDRWIELSSQAVERSAAIGDATRQVASLMDKASALNFFSVPLEAIPANELAVEKAEQLQSPGWLSAAEYGLGQAYLTAGRYRDAEQVLGRAHLHSTTPGVEIPIGTTQARLSLLSCMMKGVAHVAMGEAKDAETSLLCASKIAEETARPYDRIAANYGRGVFSLAWGRLDQAFAALREGLTLAQQHDIKQFAPVVGCQLGHVLLQQKQVVKARDVLLEARNEAELLGHILSVLRSSLYLALATYRIDGSRDALKQLRSLQARAAQQRLEGVRAEALLYEATVLSSADQPQNAGFTRSVDDAIAAATRIEAWPLVAAAKSLLGQFLARHEKASSGVAELEEAIHLFARMKMERQLKNAEGLLAEIHRDAYSTGRGNYVG